LFGFGPGSDKFSLGPYRVSHLVDQLFIGHNQKPPGLVISAVRRPGSHLQGFEQKIFGYRLVLKFANGTPGLDQLSESLKIDHFSFSFLMAPLHPKRKYMILVAKSS
jgi:hypothetical protein